MKSRRMFIKSTAVGVAAAVALLAGCSKKPDAEATAAAAPKETIKIGVLHSLSGGMAISETTLKDAVLMMIDEQNKKGGVLGKTLEAVVVDPASDWPLFATSPNKTPNLPVYFSRD